MSYDYCMENRLIKPHAYMYTKYAGREFIDEYFHVRDKSMEKLVLKNSSMFGISKSEDAVSHALFIAGKSVRLNCQGIDEWEAAIREHKFIITADILRDMLFITYHCNSYGLNRIYPFVSSFVKKYEIFKRIFTVYDSSLRRVDENYEDISCYSMLGLLLGLYYKKTGNLKFLNAALKVNDMLCSVTDDVKNIDDIAYIYASLKTEKESVESLMRAKGLS